MDTTQHITPNGDRTQMAAPQGPAISMEVIAGNEYALATEASRGHLLVVVRSGEAAYGRRLPLNVSLVIDRSGSMEGEPLEYVKRACAYVVDLLEPADVLSIVTFSEKAEVLMPARRVVNKALVKEHITRLEPGTTTNIFDAVAAGAGQVASVPHAGYVNRVLLFTDGEATAGQKDFNSIIGLVAEQKGRGITTTALGFGPEYNEELLAGIARRSGGNYYYITRPDHIPEVFRRELESLMTIVARNLRLRMHLSKWVQVRQAYGKQAVMGARTADVVLPDLERGSAASALWEMAFDPRPAGTYRIARAELTYDDSATGRTETLVGDAVINFTADRQLVEANENPIVRQEIEVAEASRNLERTVMGMRTQQIAPHVAAGELERTKSILIEQGKIVEAQEVQKAIDDLKSGAGGAEKTLVGTIYDLDRGRKKA